MKFILHFFHKSFELGRGCECNPLTWKNTFWKMSSCTSLKKSVIIELWQVRFLWNWFFETRLDDYWFLHAIFTVITWFDLATYFLALEKIDADKLQSQMVYLKGLLEMENWRFDTNIVRRIYSLMASLATAQDQELLIFINKQIRHFDLGLKIKKKTIESARVCASKLITSIWNY